MRRFSGVGLCLLGLVAASGFAEEQETNFAIYSVARQDVNEQVELKGIFDPKPVKERVRKLSLYATPTKIEEEQPANEQPANEQPANEQPANEQPANEQPVNEQPANEQARFIHYQIMQDLEDTNVDHVRTLQICNRFGEQTVWLGAGVSFLAAAGAGDAEPEAGLDSYKAYIVLRACGVDAAPFKMTDEFGEVDKVQVRAPVILAVPVSVNGSAIEHPERYLTLYDITPAGLEEDIRATDRFGGHDLKVEQQVMLAVPTEVLDIFPPAPRQPAQPRQDMVRQGANETPVSWWRPAAVWFRDLFSRQLAPGSEQP